MFWNLCCTVISHSEHKLYKQFFLYLLSLSISGNQCFQKKYWSDSQIQKCKIFKRIHVYFFQAMCQFQRPGSVKNIPLPYFSSCNEGLKHRIHGAEKRQSKQTTKNRSMWSGVADDRLTELLHLTHTEIAKVQQGGRKKLTAAKSISFPTLLLFKM